MLSSSVYRARSAGLSLVVALVLFAGCSSDASTSLGSTTSVTADDSTTVAATDAPITVPAATTVPPTTVPAPTSTVAPEPLVLREDGLGPFDFDSGMLAVIDAITAQLGAPATDVVVAYEPVGEGIFESPAGWSFSFPSGRTVCWTGEFCAQFGGPSEATTLFIGWGYSGPAGVLRSAPNLTIGAQWDDFPSMSVFATCYVDGGGTHQGIYLVLAVDGGWDWLVPDATGNYVQNLPDPVYTRVVYMEAGRQPFQEGLDC